MTEYEIRYNKLKRFVQAGLDPYKQKFRPTYSSAKIKEEFQYLNQGEHSVDKSVSVSGRVLTIRDFGGSVFFHILDHAGTIQAFIEKKYSQELLNFFKEFVDSGDIVGIEGTVFRTKKGEITVYVNSLKILAKSLHPLPEKWHGLKDVEARFRARYLDLIMNPDVR
ncbi:MAG: OB-fold nucleic acid binding domain-containing protein [Candidatus Calescibacterium sp.]